MRTRGLLDSVIQGVAALGAIMGAARLLGLEAKRVEGRGALPAHLPLAKSGYEMSFGLPEVTRVIGSFQDEGAALQAAKVVMAEWRGGFQVYSPNLKEEFFAIMGLPESPTRFWILWGRNCRTAVRLGLDNHADHLLVASGRRYAGDRRPTVHDYLFRT